MAKKMGLRTGAAARMPTRTTTVAARKIITRKKEGRRSALAMVSPMPDLSFTESFEASLMTLSLSICAWLCCRGQARIFTV